MYVKDVTSSAHLRMVDGTLYMPFLEAAVKLHLMDNNQESVNCLQEAANFKMFQHLCELFSIVFLFVCRQTFWNFGQ